VAELYQQSSGIYGSRKIAEKLKSDDCQEAVCRNAVTKAMQDLGMKSPVSRKFTPTTTVSDPSKKPAPSILAQD